MTFVKGQSGNKAGKPPGTISKDKRKFKEALNHLLEHSSDSLVEWLGDIEKPEERFRVLANLAEYCYPKLARTEVKTEHSGEMKITRPKRPDES